MRCHYRNDSKPGNIGRHVPADTKQVDDVRRGHGGPLENFGERGLPEGPAKSPKLSRRDRKFLASLETATKSLIREDIRFILEEGAIDDRTDPRYPTVLQKYAVELKPGVTQKKLIEFVLDRPGNMFATLLKAKEAGLITMQEAGKVQVYPIGDMSLFL